MPVTRNYSTISELPTHTASVFPKVTIGVAGVEFGTAVAAGIVAKASSEHKFGFNPSLATSLETVWDGANLYVTPPDVGAEHFISSSAADTQTIRVIGLDENFETQSVDIQLQGQTKTTLGASLKWSRVFRAFNLDNTTLVGDVYVYEDDTVVLGVPQTPAKISAKITIGNDQTLMTLYTIAKGKTGYLYKVYFTPDSVQVAEFTLVTREFQKTYRTRDRVVIPGGGTSWQYAYPFPTLLPEKSDIEVRAKLGGASGTVAAGFDILLIDNA